MTQFNAYQKHDDFTTDDKRLQIVYLALDPNVMPDNRLSYDEIAKLTGYAKATVKKYFYTNKHRLAEALKKFYTFVKEKFVAIRDLTKEVFAKGSNLCYLFKFYDENGNILFSKVGTTTRTCKQRLTEEMKAYKKNYPVSYATINHIVDCLSVPPEGLESYCRAMLIKKYPNTFLKNDRFLSVDVSVDDFKQYANEYLEMGSC